MLNYSSSSILQGVVRDAFGRVLAKTTLPPDKNGMHVFELTDFPEGVLYLQVFREGEIMFSEKMVVIH